MKHRNMLKAAVGAAGLLALAIPLSSAWALTLSSPSLTVTNPGKVLMVDGNDPNITVTISAADGTFPVGKYDFGFVSGSTYTMITTDLLPPVSYSFTGGTVVDFALRDVTTNTIYSISNPINYATQYYYYPINPVFSQNPVVTSPYYHALALTWDLNKDGIADTGFDISVATPLTSHDGVAPAPVPVPAAAWLMGSGVAGLFGWAVRRRKCSAAAV